MSESANQKLAILKLNNGQDHKLNIVCECLIFSRKQTPIQMETQ